MFRRLTALHPPKPEDFEDFDAYARRITGWAGTLTALGGVALVVALWPTDLLLTREPRVREVLGTWRQAMVLIGLCGAGVIGLLWRAGRDTVAAQALFVGTAITVSFALFSSVGGPCTPWIHAGPMVPLVTLFMVVPLRIRAAMAVGAWLLVTVSYYTRDPSWMRDPFAVNVGILGATAVVFSVFLGEVLYRLGARSFLQRKELQRLASTDPLTGAVNRRVFMAALEAEAARARRYDLPLSLVMIDLDRFKSINDVHGHAVGDAVLVEAVRRWRSQLRDSDLLGRLGGEEFAVLLPQTDLDAARVAAGRLRRALADERVAVGALRLPVTASFGVVQVGEGDDATRIALNQADRALYAAKAAGRNQVRCAGSEAKEG